MRTPIIAGIVRIRCDLCSSCVDMPADSSTHEAWEASSAAIEGRATANGWVRIERVAHRHTHACPLCIAALEGARRASPQVSTAKGPKR